MHQCCQTFCFWDTIIFRQNFATLLVTSKATCKKLQIIIFFFYFYFIFKLHVDCIQYFNNIQNWFFSVLYTTLLFSKTVYFSSRLVYTTSLYLYIHLKGQSGNVGSTYFNWSCNNTGDLNDINILFSIKLGPGPSSVSPGILPTPMGPVPPGMYPGPMPMNHMMPPFMQHRYDFHSISLNNQNLLYLTHKLTV